MPYDALLTLYRAASVTASVNGDAKFLGAHRGATAIIRVGGNVTGTNPTLDWKIQKSADGVSSWTDVVAGTQITDEMVGYVDDTTTATDAPMYEVPGEDPLSVSFETGSSDYVRAVLTLGGTTPNFRVVSVEMVPNLNAYVRSGV